MKATDDLFSLIKSLSRREKKFFRNFSSMHVIGNKNRYLELFELIDNQRSYDEILIKKKFGRGRSVSGFAVMKNYLFNFILKSLKDSLVDSNFDFAIFDKLSYIRILIDKGFFSKAKKLADKTIEEAVNEGQHYLVFKAVMNAMDIVSKFNVNRTSLIELEKLRASVQNSFREASAKSDILYLENRLALILKMRSVAAQKDDEKLIREILENPALMDSDTLSNERRFRAAAIKLRGEFSLGIKDNFEKYSLIMINSSSQQMEMKRNPSLYFSAALHYLDYCLDKGSIEEFEKTHPGYIERQKIYANPVYLDKRVLAEMTMVYSGIMLRYYGLQRNKTLMESAIQNIKELLEQHGKMLTPAKYMDFCFNAALALFGLESYEAALEMNNRVINFKSNPVKDAFLPYTTIFSLIVNFKLGNWELIEYRIKSMKRNLKKRPGYFETEKLTLAFFTGVINLHDKKEILAAFTEFRNGLLLLRAKEKVFFAKLNILSWVIEEIDLLENKKTA